MAKTQDPSVPDVRFEGFTIPSLRDFVGGDPDEMLLCPVRALRRYLARTRHCRPQCRRLFVSTTGAKKEVSKAMVSYWLRETIRRAYQSSGEEDDRRFRAHEVRSIAPTLLFRRNLSVAQVLRAGVWRRQTTFTSFYLRDLTHRSLDTFSLGPVVAAQSIV